MKILTLIKQVPGTNKVEVDEETGVLKRDGVDSKMNPYDLYAIETAVRIKELVGGEITVMSMGPKQAMDILYEAFMMGADKSVLLSDKNFAGADCLATSYTLSKGVSKLGGFDLIICGKQTTDGDTAQVGAELAEILGIPHVANVGKIEKIEDDSIVVEIDMGNAIDISKIQFPCLITVDKDIYQPRLPSYRRKLETADKEIQVFSINDFDDQNEKNYGLNASPTQVERIFPPETNREHQLLEGDGDTLAKTLTVQLKNLKFI